MEQPKFDPSDPKYKKVDDLPVAIRDRFVDLKEGGFVKSTVVDSDKKAKKDAEELEKWKIENSTFLKKRMSLILNRIMDSSKKNTMNMLYEQAKDARPIDVLISNAQRSIEEQLYVEMFQEMEKGLEENGRKGFLFCEENIKLDCKDMYGEIDNLKIDANFDFKNGEDNVVKIDEHTISKIPRDQIIEQYRTLAFDKDILRKRVKELCEEVTKEIKARYLNQRDMNRSKAEIRDFENASRRRMEKLSQEEANEKEMMEKINKLIN